MNIKIDHIAKIEGHMGMTADIAQGNVKKVWLEVQEGARLLEGILRDRSIFEVSQISARICGVCPVVHTLTSLKALEAALNIEVSTEDKLLREIMMMGQLINSHTLHLFFFSLADFYDIKNDLDLIKKFPNHAQDALAIREFGNQIVEIIGGRSIHPLTPTIGGFLRQPDKKKLARLFEMAPDILAKAEKMATIFSRLKYPDFVRSSPYASLQIFGAYAIYDGLVKTPSKNNIAPAEFLNTIKEFQVDNDVAKRALISENKPGSENSTMIKNRAEGAVEFLLPGKPFMVGALSRLNNNADYLAPRAKKIFKAAKIHLPNFNPFYNILAQAIETVNCVEQAQKFLHRALTKNLTKTNKAEREKTIDAKLNSIKTTSIGTAAMEAPRGTLYYFYEIGPDGLVKNCNIITPTSQNLARIEKDLEEFLPKLIGKKAGKEETETKIKMLVRAYDPCLTCATH